MVKLLDQIRPFFMPHKWDDTEPECHAPTKYEAQFGFKEGERKPIEFTATEEEMNSIGLEDAAREVKECVHAHIAFRGCLKQYNPFYFMCKGYRNELTQCFYNKKISDMKEFEREKRLNIREKRLREMMSS